jgi:hypothetical protein
MVHQSSGLSEANGQDSFGQRVHGTGVSYLLSLTSYTLDATQGIHGGHAWGLVEVEKPVDG